jgi:hypothetical protein
MLVTQRAMTDWKFSDRAVPASKKASQDPQMMIMDNNW